MRTFFTTALLLSLLTVCAAAGAQSSPSASDIKKAAAAFDRGREAYRNDSYVEAAEHFEAAESYAPSPASLRLAIASRNAAGQLDRAATLAALAVQRYPDESTLMDEAKAVLAQAEDQLGRINVSCDEPCELLLDNKLVPGERAASRLLFVDPGAHNVRANWPGDRVEAQEVSPGEGQLVTVDFYAPPPQEEAPAPVDSSQGGPTTPPPSGAQDTGTDQQGWSPVVFWSGLGLTAVGGAFTTYFGVEALNGVNAVKTECVPEDTDCPAYKQGLEHQRNANIAAGATAAVGVFTLITGIWLTDWDGKPEDRAELSIQHGGVTIRPLFAVGDGATIGASGTF